jgi:hypothetical protein
MATITKFQPDVGIASGFYSDKIQEKNETIMGSLENEVYP